MLGRLVRGHGPGGWLRRGDDGLLDRGRVGSGRVGRLGGLGSTARSFAAAVRGSTVRRPAVRGPAVRRSAVQLRAVDGPRFGGSTVWLSAVREPADRRPAVRRAAQRRPAAVDAARFEQPAVSEACCSRADGSPPRGSAAGGSTAGAVRAPRIGGPRLGRPAVRRPAVRRSGGRGPRLGRSRIHSLRFEGRGRWACRRRYRSPRQPQRVGPRRCRSVIGSRRPSGTGGPAAPASVDGGWPPRSAGVEDHPGSLGSPMAGTGPRRRTPRARTTGRSPGAACRCRSAHLRRPRSDPAARRSTARRHGAARPEAGRTSSAPRAPFRTDRFRRRIVRVKPTRRTRPGGDRHSRQIGMNLRRRPRVWTSGAIPPGGGIAGRDDVTDQPTRCALPGCLEVLDPAAERRRFCSPAHRTAARRQRLASRLEFLTTAPAVRPATGSPSGRGARRRRPDPACGTPPRPG